MSLMLVESLSTVGSFRMIFFLWSSVCLISLESTDKLINRKSAVEQAKWAGLASKEEEN